MCVSVFSYHQVLVAAELDGGAMHGAVRRVFTWLRDSSHLHTDGKNVSGVTTVHVSQFNAVTLCISDVTTPSLCRDGTRTRLAR